MKRLFILAVTAAVLVWAAPSFALVDGEVFGGYNFGGEYRGVGLQDSYSINGGDYGARAHLTGGFLIVDYGLGGYFQQRPLDFDVASKSYTLVNTNYGFDGFLRLGLIPIVKPYLRAGLSIADYNEAKGNSQTRSETKYFNSYYTGIGVGLTLPVPVVTLMVYGEYLYNHQIYTGKLTGNTFNLGISLGI